MPESFENKQIIPETKSEEENSPEIPRKFDGLVVLAKGWREYTIGGAKEGFRFHLSMESKMTSLAAGEMLKAGLADIVIFSGGKTAGKDLPSEAKALWDYTKSKYPDIPEEKIVIEEESFDTIGAAEKVYDILEKFKLKNVALLTIGFHLPRSEKIFTNYGIKVHGIPSEEVLRNRSPDYQRFLERYLSSSRVRTEKIKEAILRGLLIIDAKGKIPRLLTKRIRHGSEN